MDRIRVVGGRPLEGTVRISGAKNASLPDLCAALLSDEPVVLSNVPEVRDIRTMGRVLADLGAQVEFRVGGSVEIRAATLTSVEAPYELVKTMRASVLVLGPLVAREGRARVSLPGGCAIGARPINLHLAALQRMGAEIEVEHGYVEARAKRLHGAEIAFDTVTVTGTENVMMAACLAEGETVIRNAACEPEITDLADLLARMGAAIEGAGTPTIRVVGKDRLAGARHAVIPDRIETGTYLAACAIAGGDVEIQRCQPAHLRAVIDKFRETGVRIEEGPDNLRVRAPHRVRAADVKTQPYPGFPTDMQAQYMALMTQAAGRRDDQRDDLREPLHARGRARAHGGRHQGRRPHRGRARPDAALGRAGDGHRPARLGEPRARRSRRRGRDDRRPRLPSRPRLLPDRREAARAGSGHREAVVSRALGRALLAWYERNRRDLPWRRSKDVYRVWVSEVMLQQTTVKTVLPYYEAFLARFPSVAALAEAREEDVLAAWSGLGYYHRARSLHRAARHLTERHAGRFPRTLEAALAVPGIGLYTASAMLSIAYGQPLPVVDAQRAPRPGAAARPARPRVPP